MAGLFPPTPKTPTGTPNLKVPQTNFSSLSSRNTSSKTPTKSRPSSGHSSVFPDSDLSLKRVIGCSTTAFECHPASRSFAYTAGAAAIVVTLDENLQITQRFFRARPNAPSLQAAASSSSYPSTPQNIAQETRNRAAASLREAGIGYSPTPNLSDDSAGSKTGGARERIKAATCLSFSPDGKWLAVGETGYNPRILVFSMSKDVPSDTPVATMSEHAFGVRDVAFSPCSKYLASIGTSNDGYIYVWALCNANRGGLVRLHSSNKCTSSVRQMAWMGKNVVTVGTRHVKIWKIEDDQKGNNNAPQVLQGRNVLLGSLSESVMSTVVAISEEKALVCSERGDICLVDDVGLQLCKVASAEFGVNCIAVDPERNYAWVGGKHGNIRPLVLKELTDLTPPASPTSSRSGSPVLPTGRKEPSVQAMASMLDHLFYLDSNRSLKIVKTANVEGIPTPQSLYRELPAHKDSCQGVRLLPPNHCSEAVFFTWSAGGTVFLWTLDGECKEEFEVELEQPAESEEDLWNELKVVRVSKEGDVFVTGDKYGVLRVLNGITKECHYDVKAHGSEIMDIAVHGDTIVSCARDRAVQVFNRLSDGWSLSQTLDDHTASVTRVLLLDDGNKLLSCSTDRSIAVRELCRRESAGGTVISAYVPIRTFNIKASPVHMTTMPDNPCHLLVSTMDRQMLKLDLETGKTIHSFRPTDESGDAVVMDSITISKDDGRPRILAGTSTTDKSIRLYDLSGKLIDKEWGHTEGVSDVTILESDRPEDETTIISTGSDGTVMIWELKNRSVFDTSDEKESGNAETPKELTANRTPLRKVISRSELMSFANKGSSTPDSTTKSGNRPLGSSSPPRPLRKKASGYGMNRIVSGKSESTSPSTTGFGHSASSDSRRPSSRRSAKERSPSPPEGSSSRLPSRRGSHDTKTRARGKSDASLHGPGNANGLAESLTRSLRSFRKKLDTPGPLDSTLRPDVLRELQRELGATAQQLGGGGSKTSMHLERPRTSNGETSNESADAMTLLLSRYSEQLLTMVSDRLSEKSSREEANDAIEQVGKTVDVNGEA